MIAIAKRSRHSLEAGMLGYIHTPKLMNMLLCCVR